MNITPSEVHAHLPEGVAQWAAQLAAAELCFGVDALLLGALMDRESRGDPNAVGDKGHGHGLFQIDDRWHHSFLVAQFDDGSPMWKDPTANTMYAARLFSRNLRILGASIPAAVCSFNAGVGSAGNVLRKLGQMAPREQVIAALDAITAAGPTGKPDYVSDVLRRWESFQLMELNS